MMARYWSETTAFINTPVATVELTIDTLAFANLTIALPMVSSIPLAFIAAPKHIAAMIRKMVFIIPSIPLDATRVSTSGLPVLTETES